jgi:hypothetical protein
MKGHTMNHRTIAAGAILALALSSATALASADAATSHAPTSARTGAFTVSASVNKTEPLVGSRVTVKGSVKPAAPGERVILQLRYADQKTWKTVGTDILSGASRFKFKDKVTSVRARKYRVVKQATPKHAAGHSPSLKVTVFGWRNLTSLPEVQNLGFVDQGSLNINGIPYPDSLYTATGTQPFHIDYNLNRDCKQLKGTFGLDDRSAASGTATLSLTADGTQKFVGGFALTQSQQVSTDVTHVFRITLAAVPSNGGIGAVGSPQVLCSF